jgi:hypothetical protein
MKTKNVYLLALLILTAHSTVGRAADTAPVSVTVSVSSSTSDESAWHAVALPLRNFIGAARAYITDRRSLRIDSLPEQVTTNAQLTMPIPGLNPAVWTRICSQPSSTLTSNSLHQIFKLSVHVNPAGELTAGRVATFSFPVESVPKLVSVDAKLVLLAGALTNKNDRAYLENEILVQIREQKGTIKDKGILQLDLEENGLACDLLTGKAWLGFNATYEFLAARTTHTPIVSTDELSKIFNCSKAQGLGSKSPLFNAGVVSVCWIEATHRSLLQLGPARFQKILALVMGPSGESLQPLPNEDFAAAVASADDLSTGSVTQATMISTLIPPDEVR